MTVNVDEAARANLLNEEARAAKLTDMDLLKIAKRGLSPKDAVADLRQRFPAAFKSEAVKHVNNMTPEEMVAWKRKHGLALVAGR